MNCRLKLKNALASLVVLNILWFANCACAEGDKSNISSKASEPTPEEIVQAAPRFRARYTQHLIESAKELRPHLRDEFLLPDQINTFLAEVKVQEEYLDSDMKKSQMSKHWAAVSGKKLEGPVQQFAESRYAPYDLRYSIAMLEALGQDQRLARSIGDEYLASRFSSLHDKFLDHLNVLCFLDDVSLAMLAGSSLMVKDNEDRAKGQ